MEIAELNTDLQQEYTRQREHLERNLATLKKKVVKESELHRANYVRIMQVPAYHLSSLGVRAPEMREPVRGPSSAASPLGPQMSSGPTSFP